MTKALANRLKPLLNSLISPKQCSFDPGRHSSDNIVIAQEVFHSMRTIKVDLEEAYDRISWDFIYETLSEVGFNQNFCNLLISCVSLCSFQVLFNGSKTTPFIPSRGIRQGDPISPYLFVMCMERLAHLIQKEVVSGAWKPVC